MKRSTASFIAYQLRPSKQIERQLLINFVRCAAENDTALASYHYVGMGGISFYDFHLVHRLLGLRKMTSLERNTEIYPRCEFNRPFGFLKVLNQTSGDYLASSTQPDKCICWFDYDDGINPDITADITSLGAKLKPGGFAFVTVCAVPFGVLDRLSTAKRLNYFQEHFGDFAIGLNEEMMADSAFPDTVCRILSTAFQNAFAPRTDGKFLLQFRVSYKDSTPMITVGGYLGRPNEVSSVVKRLKKRMPFLMHTAPYQIRNFNLTERERNLFDVAATNSRKRSKEASALRALGFEDKHIELHQEIIRFIPRYQESII